MVLPPMIFPESVPGQGDLRAKLHESCPHSLGNPEIHFRLFLSWLECLCPTPPRPSPREGQRWEGGRREGAARGADRPRQRETQWSARPRRIEPESSGHKNPGDGRSRKRERERGERGSRARHRGPHKMRDGDVRMPGKPRRAQRATDRGAGVSGP